MRLVKIMNNFHVVTWYDWKVWFSYEEIIAFKRKEEFFLTENSWGVTTGKHINYIKELYNNYKQVPKEEFETLKRIHRIN